MKPRKHIPERQKKAMPNGIATYSNQKPAISVRNSIAVTMSSQRFSRLDVCSIRTGLSIVYFTVAVCRGDDIAVNACDSVGKIEA